MRTKEEIITLCKELFTANDDLRTLVRLCPNRNIATALMQFWSGKKQPSLRLDADDLLRTIEEMDSVDDTTPESLYPDQDVVRLGPDSKGYVYFIDRINNEVIKRVRNVGIKKTLKEPGSQITEDIWHQAITKIGDEYNNLNTMQDRDRISEIVCVTGTLGSTQNIKMYFSLLCVFGHIEKGVINEIVKARSNTSQSSEKQQLFVDTIYDLPLGIRKAVNTDIESVRTILDAKLYNLAEVKQAIVEYVAIMLHSEMRGMPIPILLIGPPGVGKTSIAQAIANAVGLPFYSFSLGGASDNAVFRGHHSSWSESTPGGIIRMLISMGCENPVVLIDEIDKAGISMHGAIQDIISELLDPAQSANFRDNYMGFPVDLSHCLYILTANDKSRIPDYLLDRCEIIEIKQYTPEEKAEIIQRYLINQVCTENFLRCKVEVDKQTVVKMSLLPSLREVKRVIRSSIAKVLTTLSVEEASTIILDESTVDIKAPAHNSVIGFNPLAKKS